MQLCGSLPSIVDESSKDKEGSAGEYEMGVGEDDDSNDRAANY